MEVLLRGDVPRLGRRGEVVKVAHGYARNYLIPQGLAVAVNPGNLQQIEQEKRRLAMLERKRVDDLKAVADQLANVSVTIQAKATEEGHLFGSVTENHIVDVLKTEGFAVTEDMVRMESHLKELGMFEVTVVFEEGVEATVKVWVVAE